MNIKFSIASAALLAFVACASVTSVASAQLHEGRITDSFTEPIEKSVSASADAGIIVTAHVREGDRVRVGDPLASINHSVLKQTLAIAVATAQSTARLDSARSQFQLVESQLNAITGLVSGGHTSPYEVEQKKAEHQQAIAEFRSAEEEIALAKLEVKRIQAQINDRIIKSPIDGFVTEIHKQPGENVSQNAPEYATIVRVDQLKVRFYLDSKTLLNSTVGDKVSLGIGAEKKPIYGSISFISPVIDPDSGLGRLDVVIENRDLSIQSGIACYWQSNSSTASKLAPQKIR